MSATDDSSRAAWEDWGRVDPFWAVLTAADASHGRWDVDRFFKTGEDSVRQVLEHASFYGRPERRGLALDFGCGLGRLTRALAPEFERTVGLDIAFTMIKQARQLDGQRGASGAEFAVYEGDLTSWAGSVDFLLSLLVLQHLPSREAIEHHLREFVRALTPGGIAVVQVPSSVPPAPPPGPVPLRHQARRWLRAVGMSPRFLYERLGWMPAMTMTAVPADDAIAVLEGAGARIFDAPEQLGGDGVMYRTYFFG